MEANMSILIEVVCPNGFNDMKILSEGVKPDGKVTVTEAQFKQMKQSNPTVLMVERKLKLNEGAKKRMTKKAKPQEEKKDGKSEA
jgi:hypothetical protein